MADVLYAARGTNQTTSDLYTVDETTGALTSVGPIGFAVTGLAWDPVGGVMYGATSNNSATGARKLCTIDLSTGAGTLIGLFGGGTTVMSDIACDSAGNLYGLVVSSPGAIGLHSINKATGAATSIGGALFTAGGLAFDSGDTLWFAIFDSGTPGATIFTVDVGTGAFTPGAAMSGYGVSGTAIFGALSFDALDVLYAADNHRNASPPTVDLVTITTPAAVAALVGAFSVTGVDALAWKPDAAPPPPAPTVTSFDPITGPVGTVVTITGTDLTGATAVTFNGTAAISFTVDSSTQITATVPAGATTGPIAVTTPDGTGTSGDDFTVTVPATLADGGRVSIAFDDTALEPDPTWTVIDNTPGLVAGFDIRGGRQTEFDITETSTATVFINDTDGRFDPSNTGSPYFGNLDGKQILLQLWNPVTEELVARWRGTIDDYGYDFDPAVNAAGEPLVANVAIQCVGRFEYLASVEMLPGTFGDTPPVGSEGIVFYEDTDFQTRVTQLLTDAGLPADMFRVFTGNVDVQETKYDPGDSILMAVRDAVDAEFPGIANVYEDRFGRVVVHGRLARFDPETTAIGSDWIFTRWKAGDGAAIELDADRAQIRPPLTWSRPRSRIYNAAIAYPRFPVRGTGGGTFTEADMAGQIVVDPTSRDEFGYRSYPAMSDLITLRNFNNSNDAKTETQLFAQYYVDNYKDPRTRVEALTFKSISPDDPRGPVTWAFLCGFDISDIVDLSHGYPGGVGLVEEPFYIEGYEMSVRPLNPYFDMVEVTLNVSPAAYYPPDYWTP